MFKVHDLVCQRAFPDISGRVIGVNEDNTIIVDWGWRDYQDTLVDHISPAEIEDDGIIVVQKADIQSADEAVGVFYQNFGKFGREVLYAYSDVDPFNIGVSDWNPDEYLPEARRFFMAIMAGRTLPEAVDSSLCGNSELMKTQGIDKLEIMNQINQAFDSIIPADGYDICSD